MITENFCVQDHGPIPHLITDICGAQSLQTPVGSRSYYTCSILQMSNLKLRYFKGTHYKGIKQ